MSPLGQIVLVGIGTYLIRVSGIVLIGRGITLGPGVEATLRLIAPAVLAAIVAQSLLVSDGGLTLRWEWLVAAAIGAAVSVRTGSAGWTMLSGMAAVWLLGLV